MKIKNIFLTISILILTTSACQSFSPQAEPTALPAITRPQLSVPLTEADVSRIDVHEAKAALDSGQAILVDVRSAESYAAGHAAGAISIPLVNFEDNVGSLSLEKSEWIITYCT
ncbi:MAG: rhodanese-like domain-containing protein [Chloroflexi bacterium]|nr:rhodanese-like domain-containing protein [Chloroflexota bacterium]